MAKAKKGKQKQAEEAATPAAAQPEDAKVPEVRNIEEEDVEQSNDDWGTTSNANVPDGVSHGWGPTLEDVPEGGSDAARLDSRRMSMRSSMRTSSARNEGMSDRMEGGSEGDGDHEYDSFRDQDDHDDVAVTPRRQYSPSLAPTPPPPPPLPSQRPPVQNVWSSASAAAAAMASRAKGGATPAPQKHAAPPAAPPAAGWGPPPGTGNAPAQTRGWDSYTPKGSEHAWVRTLPSDGGYGRAGGHPQDYRRHSGQTRLPPDPVTGLKAWQTWGKSRHAPAVALPQHPPPQQQQQQKPAVAGWGVPRGSSNSGWGVPRNDAAHGWGVPKGSSNSGWGVQHNNPAGDWGKPEQANSGWNIPDESHRDSPRGHHHKGAESFGGWEKPAGADWGDSHDDHDDGWGDESEGSEWEEDWHSGAGQSQGDWARESKRLPKVTSAPDGSVGSRNVLSPQQRSQILNSLLTQPNQNHHLQSGFEQQPGFTHQKLERSHKQQKYHLQDDAGKRKKRDSRDKENYGYGSGNQSTQSHGWGDGDGGWGTVPDDDLDESEDSRRVRFSPETANLWVGSQPARSEHSYSMPSRTLAHAYQGTTTTIGGKPHNQINDYTNIQFTESKGAAIEKVKSALFGKTRFARDRIYWGFSPEKDERVVNVLNWVEKLSYQLGSYGLHKFLQTRERGALFVNADFRVNDQYALDWLTFDHIQKSMDRILQESVTFYDPTIQVIVFVFLPSKSANSVAIWRRKINVPNNTRLMLQRQIVLAMAGLRNERDYVIHVDEMPDKPKSTPKQSAASRPASAPPPALPEKKKKKRKWWKIF